MRPQPINLILSEYDLKTFRKAQDVWEKYMETEPGSPEWKDADLQWSSTATMLAHMLFSKMGQKELMQ